MLAIALTCLDSSFEEEYKNYSSDGSDIHETSKLLPPSGISSNEMEGYGSSYFYAPQRQLPGHVTLASQFNVSGNREIHDAALLEYQVRIRSLHHCCVSCQLTCCLGEASEGEPISKEAEEGQVAYWIITQEA